MADNVISQGRYEVAQDIFNYQCVCGNGSGNCYGNSATGICDCCETSGAVGTIFSSNRQRAWRNMSGGNFSMKNILIYGAIGVAAFYVYKRFVK